MKYIRGVGSVVIKHFLLLYLVLILCLPGCIDPRGWESSERIQQRGWAAPPKTHHPDPLYCYDSIGQKDCYARPLVGEEDRLIASYEGKLPKQVYPRNAPVQLQAKEDKL